MRRKIIRLRAEESPNVRRALECIARGLEPDGIDVLPGVLSWKEYQRRRQEWDKVKQCVGLDGEFWEGAETLLYPPDWLNRAERIAASLGGRKRQAKAVGVDPAEGGDDTAMAAVDELGIVELVSRKTPDTNVIVGEVIAFGRKHNVTPERWLFDAGGGKTHVDRLKAQGYDAVAIPFGAAVTPELRRGMMMLEERQESRLDRYLFKNLRAFMFWSLRELLDPSSQGWGIPAEMTELRRQLSLIPMLTDEHGRIRMLSKNKRNPTSKEPTLTDLLGRSPDHADAVVLAIHGMQRRVVTSEAGVY